LVRLDLLGHLPGDADQPRDAAELGTGHGRLGDGEPAPAAVTMPPAQLRALHVTFAHADAEVEQPAEAVLFVRMADRQPDTVAVRVPFRLAVAQAARQVLVAVQQLASDEVLHVEGIRDGTQQLRPEGLTLGQGDAHPLLVVAIRRVPTRTRY